MRRANTALVLVCLSLLAVGSCRAQAPQQGLPDSILQAVPSPTDLPKATYVPVQAWQAEKAGHNTGRLVDDPEADGGTAWEVKPGQDAVDTALYGPYIEVPPGTYVAFVRMKLTEPLEDDTAGSLDACVSYAQRVLTQRDLRAADLPLGRWAEVPIGFQYDGGKLEVRFTWSGIAALRLDRVDLFRLEGAKGLETLWRVPQPVPTGKPSGLPFRSEKRPFSDLFPRAKTPARTLLVCDLLKERADTRLLVYCLQGLVNRAEPRVYCLSSATDQRWLDHILKTGLVAGTQPATVQDLLTRFRDCFKGVVVPDAALPGTRNIATMLASVEDGLVASQRLARQLNLPVLEDLHGRWKNHAEAYRWALDNLWPKMNHHVLACLWPDFLSLRDYLVANRVFIFWLPGPIDGARSYSRPQGEVALVEELLAKAPPNIPILGYSFAGQDVGMGEGPGVSLFAEFGKYLVGSIDCANLSVHSGFDPGALRQDAAPPAPKLDPAKTYYSFIISDGDNLPVLQSGNFPQLWDQKERGRFPIGWTMSPSSCLLIPDIVSYYFATASPDDCFLGAVSGIGYTYPDLYGKRFRDAARVFDGFLDQTGQYMERCDLKSLWVMNASRPPLWARYAERIPFLEALFPDYGRTVSSADDATVPTARNVPVFRAVTGWRMEATREERISDLVTDIRRMTPAQKPGFLHVFAINWFTDLGILEEVTRRLGPDYVCVRPDHLAQLWQEDMRRRQVTIQMASAAAAIEGQPLAIRATVRNVSDRPLKVRLSLGRGLEAGRLSATAVSLKPAEAAAATVTGRPVGDAVTVMARGDFGRRQATVALTRVPRAEILGQLPAVASLTPVSLLAAASMAHNAGQAQADPTAVMPQVWVGRTGTDRATHIVFGPYQPLDPGRYVVLFRLKRLGEGLGRLASLDAAIAGTGPQTGTRDVQCEELPLGQWRWVPITFKHPGGAYETRVLWSGAASLAVDAIALWRIGDR